jgi:hypothetical protein
MGARPSTRAVSITIGYIVLLAALLVIRLGRQHLFPADAPADTAPRLVSQPAPPAASPIRTEAPTAIETPTKIEPVTNAAAPAAAAKPSRPEKIEAPIPRSRIGKPETQSASARVTAPPLAPMAAATSGDARATHDVDRTDAAIVPPPALPETLADPRSLGEAVEAVTLPPVATAPAVREIAPRDRVYQKESSALAQVLGHYEQAYDRLDATGAAAVWPSVDARALSRAFARLQTQDLNFGNCTFSVSANDAAARCAGVLRYARRIGDTAPKIEQHVWTIEFARAGETWQIIKISAQ